MNDDGVGGHLVAECEKGMSHGLPICIPATDSLSNNYIYGVQSKKKGYQPFLSLSFGNNFQVDII